VFRARSAPAVRNRTGDDPSAGYFRFGVAVTSTRAAAFAWLGGGTPRTSASVGANDLVVTILSMRCAVTLLPKKYSGTYRSAR
jgi:hypothetical protein